MNGADCGAPHLDLRFARRGERTVLDRRLFAWPFTLTRSFHLDRSPAHMLTLMVQTASGAIQADDRLDQVIHVEAGAAAHVTGQGATAVHRAPAGRTARETVRLRVEDGGYLEYWPEPKILFPEAALTQSLQLTCRPGGMALLADAFMLHDPGGRDRAIRRFEAETIVRGEDPEPMLVDRMAFGDDVEISGRFRAFGNAYAIVPAASGITAPLLDRWTAAFSTIDTLYAAASLLPNGAGVGLRFAAQDGIALRHALDLAWTTAREAITGAPPPSRRK